MTTALCSKIKKDAPQSLKLLMDRQGAKVRVLLAECEQRGYGPAETYAYLLAQKMRGMTKTAAKLLAGYAPTTSTGKIDTFRATVETSTSIDEQRRKLQTTAGYTLEDNLAIAKGLRDDKEQDGKVRVAAIKVIGSFLGHEAPKEISVSHTHELSSAVKTLRNLGVSPMDARQTITAIHAEYTVLDNTPEQSVVNQ
jgi:hypothetical protein